MISPSKNTHKYSTLSNPIKTHQPNNIPTQTPITNQPINLNQTPNPNPILSLLINQLKKTNKNLKILKNKPPTTPTKIQTNLKKIKILKKHINQIIKQINKYQTLNKIKQKKNTQKQTKIKTQT